MTLFIVIKVLQAHIQDKFFLYKFDISFEAVFKNV